MLSEKTVRQKKKEDARSRGKTHENEKIFWEAAAWLAWIFAQFFSSVTGHLHQEVMWHRFYEKKVIWFCLRNTISGSYLKQNHSNLIFQTRTIFLKWVSTQLVTWPKCVIFKIMNYLFLNTNFTLKLQGKCRKDDVVTFTAHLSVNIKCLTRYKQRVVLAATLEGKSMPSNTAASTNHTALSKNQSAIKYLLCQF